jgi:hypothetical protein
MKKSSLIISFFFLITATDAQSIVGSWKCLSNVLVNADGTKQDLWKNITEAFACATDMQYVFDANGTHYVKASKDCQMITTMSNATWSISENTITVTTKVPIVLATTYTLSYIGNSVIFTHVYTPAEKALLKIKTKKIIITYQKI